MSRSTGSESRPARSNRRTVLLLGAVLAVMTGMGFAFAPLYRVFCQVTGYDGTTGRAEAAPGTILDRTIDVRFDANVRDLPWTFRPDQKSQSIRIGETAIAHFTVVNNGTTPITGQATFNVVPEVAGAHFKKVSCFCFTEQTLQPGEKMDFPVVYFVDPAFAKDPDTRRRQEVVLSYTFFPSMNGEIKQGAAQNTALALGEPLGAGL